MTFSQTFLVLTALVHYWSGVHSFEVPHQCDSAPILNLIDGDLNLERTPNSPGNVTLVTLLSANSRVGRRQAKECGQLSFFIPYPLSKFSRPFVSVALNETYVKFPCDICPLLNPIDLGNDTSSASDEQDVDVDAVFEEDVGDVPVEREPGLATADPDSVETENAEITEDDVGVQPKQALSEEERRREMTLSTLLRYWEVKRFQSYVQQKDGGSVTGSPPEMPGNYVDRRWAIVRI
ncbi:unnamed protein product [Cyprideis torosa]|uniref:Uncharacterized protein n=1 Tax=Cyprideis torosa TaxID=163714 RepID=A0A7R8ZQT4_9CRUS|nr:unnamed protein product [Cyprideis torosa]CAG0891436.1 unnamed protein product [Cyprideis torosa]